MTRAGRKSRHTIPYHTILLGASFVVAIAVVNCPVRHLSEADRRDHSGIAHLSSLLVRENKNSESSFRQYHHLYKLPKSLKIAAIGARATNSQFVPHTDVLADKNAAPCTNGRNAKAAPQRCMERPKSGWGRSCWSGRDRLAGSLRCG
jgi:hypothetical protein